MGIAHRLSTIATGSLFAAALIAAPIKAAADCTPGEPTGQQVVGTVLGAVIGGLLGSQVGGGTGQKLAIGAGAVAGGLLGSNFGRSLDCEDQQYHSDAAQDALENQQAGTATTWRNPDTGHAGSVVPTSTYQRQDGQYCRDFTQTVTVEGQFEEAAGTACRQPDGTWQIVS